MGLKVEDLSNVYASGSSASGVSNANVTNSPNDIKIPLGGEQKAVGDSIEISEQPSGEASMTSGTQETKVVATQDNDKPVKTKKSFLGKFFSRDKGPEIIKNPDGSSDERYERWTKDKNEIVQKLIAKTKRTKKFQGVETSSISSSYGSVIVHKDKSGNITSYTQIMNEAPDDRALWGKKECEYGPDGQLRSYVDKDGNVHKVVQ